MKNNVLVILALILIGACKNESKTVISGQMSNGKDVMVYLFDIGKEPIYLDSIMMKNGKFTLSTEKNYPRTVALSFGKDIWNRVELFLEKGHIYIKGDLKKLRSSEVSGTFVNNKFIEYDKIMNPLRNKMSEIQNEYYELEKQKISDTKRVVMEKDIMMKHYVSLIRAKTFMMY